MEILKKISRTSDLYLSTVLELISIPHIFFEECRDLILQRLQTSIRPAVLDYAALSQMCQGCLQHCDLRSNITAQLGILNN